ncbi:MAG TPA: hypothetical protein VFP44_00370 [Usitatibacter sp.]|nr:hypothetical protein [Usitatibacter sp.]
MARTAGGWIALVVVLVTGAWLEFASQGSDGAVYQESTYGMQSDTPAGSTNIAQATTRH